MGQLAAFAAAKAMHRSSATTARLEVCRSFLFQMPVRLPACIHVHIRALAPVQLKQHETKEAIKSYI